MNALFTVRGREFACQFDYEQGEPQTWDEPGWPDIFTLIRVHLDGVDVTDLLDPAIVQELEDKAGIC
jgi:hypothetical protein